MSADLDPDSAEMIEAVAQRVLALLDERTRAKNVEAFKRELYHDPWRP